MCVCVCVGVSERAPSVCVRARDERRECVCVLWCVACVRGVSDVVCAVRAVRACGVCVVCVCDERECVLVRARVCVCA